MSNFEILQSAYKENLITKQDIYDQLINGKISIEDYKLITNDTEIDMPLEVVKQNKIKELNDACYNVITNGFYSSAHGEEILYGYDNTNEQPDQQNMSELWSAINTNIVTEPVQYKGKGQQPILEYTFEQFRQLVQDAAVHKMSNQGKYFILKDLVLVAETKEDINSIVW